MDFESKSVLITGGRGFIGWSTAEALRNKGYHVISVDVNSETAGSDEVVCDISDRKQVRTLFQKEHIDAIVHLAAILPTAAQRDPVRATQVNVAGSLNCLELAKEFGVRRFVFGSSLSVYGTCPVEQIVSENYRVAPEDLYGAAKVYVEQLGEAYRRAHGGEFVSLRIGRVVGPGARSTTSAWRSEVFECMGGNGSAEIAIPYAESERILLVHVDDVAKMLVELVRVPRLAHGVYNAGCESVVVGELKAEIERLNPRVRVMLWGEAVVGNPRRVDWSRIGKEFGVQMVPIFDQLERTSKSAP